MLHALADKGETRILATGANVNDPYAPGALDAINTYYGRPNIPVGRNLRQPYSVATPYWRDHDPRFVRDLATKFPNDTSHRQPQNCRLGLPPGTRHPAGRERDGHLRRLHAESS